MSDTYQAIYDAIRSRISSCDVGAAIREAAHLDGSFAIQAIHQEFCAAAAEMQRPSVLYRPTLTRELDEWRALYGANMQDGVAGYGSSPAAAMADFDRKWNEARRA